MGGKIGHAKQYTIFTLDKRLHITQYRMKKTGTLVLLSFLISCQAPTKESHSEEVGLSQTFLSPDEELGQLFVDVQMAQVFPDGKTFVDCVPKKEPAEILKKYLSEKSSAGFDLKSFVLENFELPPQPGADFKSDSNKSVSEHINSLWPVLTRQPDAETAGSLIPLPHPYIVPGGRFREIYYWDSYFTMLGLQAAGRDDMIANMVDNFAHLIDTVGYVPNGNRTYFIGRSQPPFFSLMVGVLAEMRGEEVYQKYLPQLKKEHAFWMDGTERLEALRNSESTVPQVLTHRRVVNFADGNVLNRYWDDKAAPRPESYREDVETMEKSGRPAEEIYRNLRAGCESGWDFSSRWLADGQTLEAIHTTDIIPVDLNALLYHLEFTLANTCEAAGDLEAGKFYIEKAKARAEAIQKYCWQPTSSFFMDYDFVKMQATPILSLAGVYPLFFKLATPDQAARMAETVKAHFLKPGGVVTTPNNTGQQWDAPNGWAPLQWMAIDGLRRYGHADLAREITRRWVALNTKVYNKTGKMVEKYNVEDTGLLAGGGEYELQDGFGWTNGVLLRLLTED